ncbi:hypothetical protein HYG81_13380 [Natrinema zhouii]|uniref:Uncharacterized protein n=1 Tax=Natrinema zhouii TaxID=1710539 RepID=A0A7D6CPI7_9EURY|nr:hypothetical protein [Natrinema zhouii]QLK25090.1 hypothetical protein HYG81_13380 [Natrinema zhouii]
MGYQSTGSNGVSTLLVAVGLLAALGGIGFLVWRWTAPLTRRYRQLKRRTDERDRREPNPQREPGTDPL